MEDQMKIVEKYLPLIRQNLIPSQILPHLMCIDEMHGGVCGQIFQLESNGQREKACDELMECLLKSNDPGWFQTFMTALKQEDFEILARTIEGYQDVKKQDIFYKLMAIFANDLCQVDTVQVIPLLRETGCINDKDTEELIRKIDTKGNFQANLLMLCHLPKKSEDWFPKLLYALKQSGNTHLVEIISEKISEAETCNDMMEITDRIYQDNMQQHNNESVCNATKKVVSMQICEPGFEEVYQGEMTLVNDEDTDKKQPVPRSRRERVALPKPVICELDLREDNKFSMDAVKEGPCTANQNVSNTIQSTSSNMTSDPFSFPGTVHSNLSNSSKEAYEKSTGTTMSYERSYRESVNEADLEAGNNQPPEKKNKYSLGTRMPPIGQEADNTTEGRRERSQMESDSSNNLSSQLNNLNKKDDLKKMEKTLFTEETMTKSSSQKKDIVECMPKDTDGCSLHLRSYQKELAIPAIQGKNSLIVSPTGSGKTHVALYISKNHLETCDISEVQKVLFIVPTVALVQQQEAVYKKYLSEKWKIIAIFGDIVADKASLKLVLPNYDIFVITPQILVDALGKEEIESLNVFSLIIFDECHHTMKSHPYNAIMNCYFQEKEIERNINLPQIVGLTASVGVGKATTVDTACDHILKLCANLDADIHTVQKEAMELKKYTNVPVEESHEVCGRQNDTFQNIIHEIMGLIERKMEQTSEVLESAEVATLRSLVKPPNEKGCDRYTQWISGLRRPVAIIYEQKVRRIFVACINHLKTYNEALLLNADCRSKDALKHIKEKFGEFKEAVPFHDETDKWLDKIFYAKESSLRKISEDPRNVNPKLMKIKELLQNQYRETPDLRAIIFVKTRDMTIALENWLNEDPQLKELKPSQLVGAGVSSDRGGMTQQKQNDVVTFFKNGKHKVILATTIAEEGLDIKKCNLVIKYEHVTNETARIQSKGRSRDEDSKYMLVASKDSSSLTKEEINKEREELMYQAIAVLLTKPAEEIQKRKQHFQEREQTKRKNKEIQQLAQASLQNEMTEEDYELRCIKCDAFTCFSFDICTIQETNHVVISPDFKKAVVIEKHPRPGNMGDLKKVGKLFCAICHYDWGVEAIYNELKYPCIKINSFVLVDSQDKRDTCKKWKFSPFEVREITIEDQKRMATMQ